MKRLVTFLLTLCLVMSFVPLAYAEDSIGADDEAMMEQTTPDSAGEQTEDQDLADIPNSDDISPVKVGTLEELQAAINAAEDGDTIIVTDLIYLVLPGDTIGVDDKTVVLEFEPYSDWTFLSVQTLDATIKNVVLRGHGLESGIVSKNVINVLMEKELTMDNVTVQGFVCDDAPLASLGYTSLKNCYFEGNSGKNAGHVWNEKYGTLEVSDSSFLNGNSNSAGGGIRSEGSLTISNSKFIENTGVIGAGIYTSGDATITDCLITGNHALTNGAGICCGVDGKPATITDCEIYENHADFYADDVCNLSIMTLQYTKDIKSVYTSTDRVPYKWMNDNTSVRNGYEEATIYETPIIANCDEGGTTHLKLVFEDELPEAEDPDFSAPPSEFEDDGQELPPVDDGDGQGDGTDQPQEPPTGENEDQEPPTNGGDDQQPPTQEPSDGQDQQQPQEPSDSLSDSGEDSGHDYTPPTHRWPHTPSTSSTSTVSEDKSKDENTDIPGDNAPVEDAPRLVCNAAAIDTSKTIVLLGYGDGELHESDSLTRAQLATVIYRLLDAESIAFYSNAALAFTDITADAWYAPYVRVIQAAGIVNGVGGGKYDPNGTVTWAQIVTILTRFAEAQEVELQHIQYDGWATPALKTAVALGWIEDSAAFSPDAIISRGELVELVNGVLALYR